MLTNYGKIDMIWFDTPELVTEQHSRELRELIHSIQPECLINARIGNGFGDYTISEQKLSKDIERKPWEACITMGKNWEYNRYDTVYKKPDVIIRHLTDIVSKGGNLLLNVTPDGKGRFPELSRPVFSTLCQWMQTNGEALYGTIPWRTYGENLRENEKQEVLNIKFNDAQFDGTPQQVVPNFRYTRKGNDVYVIVRHVQEPAFTLRVFNADDRITGIKALDGNDKIDWRLTEAGLEIHVDRTAGDFPIYVFKVELN